MHAETVTISHHGAKLHVGHHARKLACGETITISHRRGRKRRTGKVVWLDHRTWQYCGIELTDPDDFWGVYFPPIPGNLLD